MAPSPHLLAVGRAGALAVALGIGWAIASNPAAASADDGATSTQSSSTESSSTESSSRAPERAAGQKNPSTPSTASRTTASDREATPDRRDRRDDTDERTGPEDDDGPEADEPDQDSDDSDDTDETTPSPLATEQQLEAERVAAETVRTLPVQLMKAVLGAGWLATAHREYDQIGGVDRENLHRLGRAVDEYAMGAAFQQQLLNPMAPTVVTQVAPPHSWSGTDVGGSRILYDNPDTVYRFMGVNMTSTYVITGRFTGQMPADTNFSVLTGLSGVTADNLGARDIDIAPDGSFTITVSGEAAAPGQRNHLQTTPDTTLIAVRNTLSDWTTQSPMTLSIERVSGPPDSLFSQLGGFAIPGLGPMVTTSPLLTTVLSSIPPLREPPLRGTFAAVIMALGVGREATYIRVATTDPRTGRRAAPNVLPAPARNAEFLATQLQSAGYFDLADDEALVVTIDPGNARYVTVPVTNLWTVTDDYWAQQTSLNNAQALANPDGTYTFVIAPTDPGVHNWVSTGGLNRGTISVRFQDLDLTSTATPTVTSAVVTATELSTVLPPTTTWVTAAQREEQLAIRRAGFAARFGVPR